jgi:hypothetical protein
MIRCERSSVSKRSDHELAIARLVLCQTSERSRCGWRKAGPKAELIRASLQGITCGTALAIKISPGRSSDYVIWLTVCLRALGAE